MRTGAAFRLVTGLAPLDPAWCASGPAVCVRHYGSVDIFLEAIDGAAPGSILVIDNDGRDDEGCIGDLVTIEAAAAGLAGIVVWGRHRDSAELREIGLPVFSRGACSSGPARLDPRDGGAFGLASLNGEEVRDGEVIAADADGVVIFAPGDFAAAATAAAGIRDTESAQAAAVRAGTSLRRQLRFGDYLAARAANPALTFREHLQGSGGAIEV